MTTCKRCQETVKGNFCSQCGTPAKIKKVDKNYIVHEIQHLLHFEQGILYTIKELLIRPGKSVRTFISDDRGLLVKPIVFIIITSLLYSLTNNYFQIENKYVEYEHTKRLATDVIFTWIQNHYGYANIMMGVFIAWWVRIFFKKQGYNLFEILILLCFIMGIGMLIISFFAVLEGLTKVSFILVSSMVSFSYCVWAIGQFFNKTTFATYLKALIAYLLGCTTFFIAAMLLGLLIELVKS